MASMYSPSRTGREWCWPEPVLLTGPGVLKETSGMMLKPAVPILDVNDNALGVLYGGTLLNRNYEIVDKIKDIIFKGERYKGKDTGTATIFQWDVRISTTVT